MIENMFNQKCVISRPTLTSPDGIATKNFTEIGTYACRLGGLKTTSENTKTGASDWLGDRRSLYLSKEAEVQKNDRITLDGENYRVVNYAKNYGLTEAIFSTCEIINWK